jgi:hypothetical protein
MSSVLDVPTEVLKIILSYTDPRDRKNVLLTCKNFYNVGRSVFPPPIQTELPPYPEPLPICFDCKSARRIVCGCVDSLILNDYGKKKLY